MIDSDARFCSPGPISSASHKRTHKKETNTHRQSVRWTQIREYFKEELIVGKTFSEYPILGRVLPKVPAAFLREVMEKRTIDLWSHKWWEMVPDTHLQKSHGPMGGEKWSQQLFKCRYLSTDLSTQSIDHRRYRRSIRIHLLENTVDIGSRCRFTYGELRSIFNGRLKIEIIFWSISSTTPV